jgi:hypothetical protein
MAGQRLDARGQMQRQLHGTQSQPGR